LQRVFLAKPQKSVQLLQKVSAKNGNLQARMSTFMLALWMAAVPGYSQSGIEHNAAYRINRRSA
jgi:hypothetical protein